MESCQQDCGCFFVLIFGSEWFVVKLWAFPGMNPAGWWCWLSRGLLECTIRRSCIGGGGYIMMSVFSGRWCEENRRQTTAAGTKFIIHCFIIAFSRMSVQYSMKYGCKSVCLNWNEVCVCLSLAHKHRWNMWNIILL